MQSAGRIALEGKPRDWYRFRTVEYGVMMFVKAVFIGWLAVRESRPHSIVLDDNSIQFTIGANVKWLARFCDIRAIGTPDKTWTNPRDTVFGDKIAANSNRSRLEHRRLLVFAPDLAEDAANLADCSVLLH